MLACDLEFRSNLGGDFSCCAEQCRSFIFAPFEDFGRAEERQVRPSGRSEVEGMNEPESESGSCSSNRRPPHCVLGGRRSVHTDRHMIVVTR